MASGSSRPATIRRVYGSNFDASPVNRLDLFDQMGVAWKGCVEARDERAYDEDDTAPTSAGDPLGALSLAGRAGRPRLRQQLSRPTAAPATTWDRLRNVDKYDVPAGTRVRDTDEHGPERRLPAADRRAHQRHGPHAARDRPMKPHNESGGNNSGTNVAQGLLWGWRVLSPDEPFSQGVAYDDEETHEGAGAALRRPQPDRRQQRRSPSPTTPPTAISPPAGSAAPTTTCVAEQNVDAKVSARSARTSRTTGIRVYTILFQVDFDETQDIFRDCASKDDRRRAALLLRPGRRRAGDRLRRISART